MKSSSAGNNLNSEGRIDVVQHAHPDSVLYHFSAVGLTASQNFILLDLSDTTNYPHISNNYLHSEWMQVITDATSNAAYSISIGYLKNIDGTNGDFVETHYLSGSKTAGRALNVFYPMYPNGERLRDENVVSSVKSLNDTAFQSDVNLASTLDPSTADTPSGDGDLVLRVVVTAGTVDISINGAYHSH